MDEILAELARQLHLSVEDVEARLGALEVIPFEFQGEVTGAAVLAGCEIHFIAKPGRRGRCGTRREVHALFQRLFEEHPFLTTRIPCATPLKDRTGERMGFVKSWSDGQFDYYIMTELPYARARTAEPVRPQ